MVNADDDPEARIRELERPLADFARAAELTVPSVGTQEQSLPPRDNLQRLAIAIGVIAAVFVFAVTLALVYFITGFPTSTTPEPSAAPTRVAPAPSGSSAASPPAAPAPGRTIAITGADEIKTVACAGNYVSVTGVRNAITLTGQCAGLTVSGIENVITVDATPRITVSGIRNRVTYRSGDPDVGTSGLDNVVEPG